MLLLLLLFISLDVRWFTLALELVLYDVDDRLPTDPLLVSLLRGTLGMPVPVVPPILGAGTMSWRKTGGGRMGASPPGPGPGTNRLPVPLGPPMPVTIVWLLPGTGLSLL